MVPMCSTFLFCVFLLPGKERTTVYPTKLISPDTGFLYILFPTTTNPIHGCILTWKYYSDDNEQI